jgi:hypothetical protein
MTTAGRGVGPGSLTNEQIPWRLSNENAQGPSGFFPTSSTSVPA